MARSQMQIEAQSLQSGPMAREELGALLNLLLEAERAGAKLLAAYLDELSPKSPAWTRLRAVHTDEARNCSVLIHHLLQAEVPPSGGTGDFYQKGLAIRFWQERLQFLNRGQRWVAKRIAEALPRLAPGEARDALQEMHRSHLVNIHLCEELIE